MVVYKFFQKHGRLLWLVLIMIFVTGTATSVAMVVLYSAAFTSKKADLSEMVKAQARLIDAVGRFDAQHSKDHPLGAAAATLSQVVDANRQQQGFGNSGEFVLGQRQGDQIVFLLPSRHLGQEMIAPLSVQDSRALPMRLALQGRSGVTTGLDYRGVKVLAAYAPISALKLGLVAKVDLREIQQPFIRAVLISFVIALGLILVAVYFFHRLTSPLIYQLEALVHDRTQELDLVNQELRFLSHHDELTGIANRSYFLQQLRKARQQELGSVALLFIDLDEFKPVNDQFGHQAGDQVLVAIAERLNAIVREEDSVARIGGDEFAVVLTDLVSQDQAVKIAGEIAASIQLPIQVSDQIRVKVGCSIGVAMDHDQAETDAAFISRADTAMYAAKGQQGVACCSG